MNLNDWSLVIFATTALVYVLLYWSVFRRPSLVNFLLLIAAYVISRVTLLVYGIATDQIGFVFIFLMDIALTMVVYTTAERSSHDHQ